MDIMDTLGMAVHPWRHLALVGIMEREKSKEQEPFRLAGSMRLVEGDDIDLVEVLEQIRKKQAELFQKKLDDILGED